MTDDNANCLKLKDFIQARFDNSLRRTDQRVYGFLIKRCRIDAAFQRVFTQETRKLCLLTEQCMSPLFLALAVDEGMP